MFGTVLFVAECSFVRWPYLELELELNKNTVLRPYQSFASGGSNHGYKYPPNPA